MSKRRVSLTDDFLETDRALYAALTERGENNLAARDCLGQLARLLQH